MNETITPVHYLGSEFDDVFIQGRSQIEIVLTPDESDRQEDISLYNSYITFEGKRYNGNGSGIYTTSTITGFGVLTITITLVNSSGAARRQYIMNVDVAPYFRPNLVRADGEDRFVCARSDRYGELANNGSYLRIYGDVVYAGCFGYNSCTVKYRYGSLGGSYSQWITLGTSINVLRSAGFDVYTTYNVQISVTDDVSGERVYDIMIPSQAVFWHRKANALGLGIALDDAEEDLFKCNWDAKFNGDVTSNGKMTTEGEFSAEGKMYANGGIDIDGLTIAREKITGYKGASITGDVSITDGSLTVDGVEITGSSGGSGGSSGYESGYYRVTSGTYLLSSDGWASNTWYYKTWDDGTFTMFGDFNIDCSVNYNLDGAYLTPFIYLRTPLSIVAPCCISGTASSNVDVIYITGAYITDAHLYDSNTIGFLIARPSAALPDSLVVHLTVNGRY